MNDISLTELSTRESAIVEWKKNVADERKLIETIVAFTNDFLNLGGGYIVCGASEATDSNGFKIVEYVGLTGIRLEEIKKYVANTCYNPNIVNPPIIPKFDEITLPEDASKKVLVITIDATNNAHTYKAEYDDIKKPRYFVRTDSNTREANNGILRELLRRKEKLEYWDKQINAKAFLTDIDELAVRAYLQEMNLWTPNKAISDYISEKEKIEQFIPPLVGKLGVGKELHPKNFTLAIFGKSPIDFCAGAYAIFTIFDGEDKSKQHAESQWITGSVIEQAKKLIELLNVESTIAIDKGTENANQIKYPKIALKEAVVNAIVHRDYEVEQPVRIEVYNNRVEIHSPGGLPFSLDKEAFIKGKASAYWRNQTFARIFQKLNLAQHNGTGIERIISAMKEEGCPEPIFEVTDFQVICTLPAHPRHVIMKQLSEAESEIVIQKYPSAYKKLAEILEKDIYNYRAIELFCNVNNLLGTPENVLKTFNSKNINFQQIRPNTLVIISESLSLLKKNTEAENLSKKLLNIAMSGRLEEQQIIKVAHTLEKLGYAKEVVDFVDKTVLQYTALSTNSPLLRYKGRSLIDLAKICKASFFENKNTRIKEKAKADFEKYITEAQKTLSIAYENAESGIDKDFVTKALEYIETDMMPFLNKSSKKKNMSKNKL